MRKLQSRPIDTIGIRYKTVESQKEYLLHHLLSLDHRRKLGLPHLHVKL